MSQQIASHLQLPSSYVFQRNSLSQHHKHSIESNRFHQWAKDNMYASSYAKHHSPVHPFLSRNQHLRELTISQDIKDSFQLIGLKVCMRKLFLI